MKSPSSVKILPTAGPHYMKIPDMLIAGDFLNFAATFYASILKVVFLALSALSFTLSTEVKSSSL